MQRRCKTPGAIDPSKTPMQQPACDRPAILGPPASQPRFARIRGPVAQRLTLPGCQRTKAERAMNDGVPALNLAQTRYRPMTELEPARSRMPGVRPPMRRLPISPGRTGRMAAATRIRSMAGALPSRVDQSDLRARSASDAARPPGPGHPLGEPAPACTSSHHGTWTARMAGLCFGKRSGRCQAFPAAGFQCPRLDEMISALQIAPGETEHHGPPTHCSFVRRALAVLVKTGRRDCWNSGACDNRG